jgi:hypothetical protein
MLKFRNLDISPSDPVEQWGVEGILTAFERGSYNDWRKVWQARKDSAKVREDVAQAVACLSPGELGYAISRLFR